MINHQSVRDKRKTRFRGRDRIKSQLAQALRVRAHPAPKNMGQKLAAQTYTQKRLFRPQPALDPLEFIAQIGQFLCLLDHLCTTIDDDGIMRFLRWKRLSFGNIHVREFETPILELPSHPVDACARAMANQENIPVSIHSFYSLSSNRSDVVSGRPSPSRTI